MKVINTKISEVKIIEPKVYGDDRGYFMETWNLKDFYNLVSHTRLDFVQDNHSKSKKGILRGLHIQTENTQDKLVRVISGKVFDVAVDLRSDSPTYGKWVGEYLSSSNRKQMWIPKGFAHGFYVMSEMAEFCYKCTDYYNPSAEISIDWNDKDLNIAWPNDDYPLLSEKDKASISFKEFGSLNAR